MHCHTHTELVAVVVAVRDESATERLGVDLSIFSVSLVSFSRSSCIFAMSALDAALSGYFLPLAVVCNALIIILLIALARRFPCCARYWCCLCRRCDNADFGLNMEVEGGGLNPRVAPAGATLPPWSAVEGEGVGAGKGEGGNPTPFEAPPLLPVRGTAETKADASPGRHTWGPRRTRPRHTWVHGVPSPRPVGRGRCG